MNEYDNAYIYPNSNWKPPKVPYREVRKNKPVNSRAQSQLKKYKALKNKMLNMVR
ncbi:MAG: hypothetical protein JSW06_02695 [Thermoplasmatales archaeon]|nr:MAG: hypothetical protein JSW06_02695 [Thermoplasmatales archaeon]